MPPPEMTREELIALFVGKATAPPAEENLLLVRHLKCKDSPILARIVAEAMDRHTAAGSPRLPAPGELLPPLG
jgi:hypothetical protein